MLELRYPLFDGERVWDAAAVTVENGIITSVRQCSPSECGGGFLMPALIDAHAHMRTADHVKAMLQNGVAAVCDVSASSALAQAAHPLAIVRSNGMAMGIVMDPKGYVEQAAANGAEYIKVLLFGPLSIGKPALCAIVNEAHKRGLKVAAHATELATVRQAVESGADILLHIPMKDTFPVSLAETIAAKGIAVAPTLVMMETYAHSGRGGYKPSHYQNAERAVKLLHDCGVTILAATDANPGSFAPAVAYGNSLHRELELLVKAGLTPTEALTAATAANADAFCLKPGRLAPGQPATMLLVDGRPDRTIADTRRIRCFWIDGTENIPFR